MRNYFNLLCLVVVIKVFLVLTGCSVKNDVSQSEQKNETSIVVDSANAKLLIEPLAESTPDSNYEDFSLFYHKFFNDSSFQRDRIIFPLKGFDSDSIVYGEKNDIYPEYYCKTKNQWHTMNDCDSTIYKTIVTRMDSIVSVKINFNEPGFNSKLIFKRFDNTWHLIELYINNY